MSLSQATSPAPARPHRRPLPSLSFILTTSLSLFLALLFAPPGADAQPATIPPSDFLILGAGTAGCTVAATICRALPRATLTLIERGSPRTPRARRRSLSARGMLETWDDVELTESFRTTPNSGLNNRRLRVLLGSNIGGSSAVNAAKFNLPPPWYFSSLGIAGLSAGTSAALFGRVTAALKPHVPRPELLPDYTWKWVNAAARAGFPFRALPFRPSRMDRGSWPPRTAFDRNGRRVDSYRGFLRPALDGACKGRVRVVRGATVRRVLFQGRRAVSAEVQFANGVVQVVRARREVLLAAGAVHSAAVLQRSGVGPRGLLNRVGVPVVADLPVGEHMQTRAVTVVASRYTTRLARVNNQTLLSRPWVRSKFDAGRGGPLGVSPFGPNVRLPGVGYLGMQIGFPGRARRGTDGNKRIGTSCLSNAGWNSFSSVRIESRNASATPVLDLRLLEKREDVQRAMRLTQSGRDVHKELENMIGASEIFFRSGETEQGVNTPQGLEKKVRADSYGSNHYVGGCAVGRVVDSRLRVRTLQGLRVVDSGAIRRIPPNAGPLTSVYIVALRAGDLVAEDHGDLK